MQPRVDGGSLRMAVPDEEWRAANRANWDERVAIHMQAPFYDVAALRAGHSRMDPIEEAELGPVAGLRVLHLQCHFGSDSLRLAERGAEVVGLDFSPSAIAAARGLVDEMGLAGRVRFVEADLYDALAAIPEPQAFDLVFVTWGAINWLPDLRRWAEIVAHFLKPGGALYLVEGHPAALVFDDMAPPHGAMPGWFAPYFSRGPLVIDNPCDYADAAARLRHARTYEWLHPLGEVVTGLIDTGLAIR
jgi:SAM-dependent methyltransferase